MPSASALRRQIEASLASRIPSALTPAARIIRPVAETGIPSVDQLLDGGLPIGSISELVGPECSGRTSLALSFLARMTREGRVCAWIDVSDALDPQSAAAIGIPLTQLLWVRCGVQQGRANYGSGAGKFFFPEKYMVPPAPIKGLHGGGHGPHPRTEIKGMSQAVSGLLRPEAPPATPHRGPDKTPGPALCNPSEPSTTLPLFPNPRMGIRDAAKSYSRPYSRLDQALRVTDLLLQAGGFSAIVLDMGSIAPEHASRVPLATWFRYRAAAERSQSSILLLSQHPCAKSSAGLVLTLHPGKPFKEEPTVFTGLEHRLEVKRERFERNTQTTGNVIPLRKPPQSETAAGWQARTTWAVAKAGRG